ncbi:hypothetical protein B4113_3433 [Geobacillus sp. B4113_201601]|nr:hypothetical protein B4113_3433 [Geobacillus sp. B4113_201601]
MLIPSLIVISKRLGRRDVPALVLSQKDMMPDCFSNEAIGCQSAFIDAPGRWWPMSLFAQDR